MRSPHLLVIASLLSLTGCDQPNLAAAPEVLTSVQVVEAAPNVSGESLSLIGEVIAPGAVDLAFEKSGRLAFLQAPIGGRVSVGDTLATLDARQFELDVQQASAELSLAELEVERLAAVHERGMSSDAALDDAKLKRDLAAVKLERARYDLSRTQLVAPFDARISRRWVENHAHVEPGQGIVSVIPVNGREVKTYLPEQLLSQVGIDHFRQATVSLRGSPQHSLPVTLQEFSVQASAVTGSYELRYSLPDRLNDTLSAPASATETDELLPGMTAIVSVTLPASAMTGVRVPVSALHSDSEGGFYVWVVSDGQVNRGRVTVTDLARDWALIDSGLTAGVLVVTTSGLDLTAGQRVTVERADQR